MAGESKVGLSRTNLMVVSALGFIVCGLAALLVLTAAPDLLRLTAPFTCPSGYDRSEGYLLHEPRGEETVITPSLRCFGSNGQVMEDGAPRAYELAWTLLVAVGTAAGLGLYRRLDAPRKAS